MAHKIKSKFSSRIRYYNKYHSFAAVLDLIGTLELKIIGELGKLITVASIPQFKDDKDKKKYARDAIKAAKYWFSEGYSKDYNIRARKGETDPYATWRRLRKRAKLPDDYDISEDYHQDISKGEQLILDFS